MIEFTNLIGMRAIDWVCDTVPSIGINFCISRRSLVALAPRSKSLTFQYGKRKRRVDRSRSTVGVGNRISDPPDGHCLNFASSRREFFPRLHRMFLCRINAGTVAALCRQSLGP